MTEDEARQFRSWHDMYVKQLSRKTRADLAALYRIQLSRQGFVQIAGGPQSKDELIRELVETEFPVAKLNEAGHVLYHKPGENWSACDHCASVTA